MLSKELLEILVCPQCKGDLSYQADLEVLDCMACKLRYKIDEGVPVMLINEATPLPTSQAK